MSVGDRIGGSGFYEVDAEIARSLLRSLRAELPPGHALQPFRDVMSVWARIDSSDDVIVRTGDADVPLGLVHMTWRGGPGTSPEFPSTTLHPSLDTLLSVLEEEFHNDI